jgi:hypothetical protein
MVEDFPATLKAIFDPNYGNIRPVSQPNRRYYFNTIEASSFDYAKIGDS